MLIDSHAHLDDRRFNRDRDRLIRGLNSDGVELVINNADSLRGSIEGVKLSEQYKEIYTTVGVHPHYVKDMDESTIETLRSFAKRDKVVAIGEIGLDFYRNLSPRDLQEKWFRRQLDLAIELDMPVTIHSRDSSQPVYDIIEEYVNAHNLRGVMHCYSDSAEMAKGYVDMGFYISLAGPVTFKNARVPKEVAKVVPLDRLLIETDSPYLTPEPNRGKRNEPAYVRYVAGEIADLKGIAYNDLVEATNRNTKELFGIK